MSKGLEALDITKDQLDGLLPKGLTPNMKWNIKTIEKELKALEIIKERRCNVADFIVDNPNWEEVIKDYDYWFSEMPTKEEYYLLKEVLL